MAIKKKPTTKKKAAESFINDAPEIKQQKNTELKSVLVRMQKTMLDELEAARKQQIEKAGFNISRNTYIIQAIKEKIKKDSK